MVEAPSFTFELPYLEEHDPEQNRGTHCNRVNMDHLLESIHLHAVHDFKMLFLR